MSAQPGGFPDILPLFEPDLIKQQRVVSVEIDISIKYDREVIRQSRKRMFVVFNDEGQTVQVAYISYLAGRTDTVSITKFYDENGAMNLELTTGLTATAVTSVKRKNNEPEIVSKYQLDPTLNWSKHLSREHLIWKDSIVKKDHTLIYYNQHGLKYKSVRKEIISNPSQVTLFTYDANGKLQQRLITTYDDEDRCTSIEEQNLNKFLFSWKRTFAYNEKGKIEEEKYFKEGELESIRRISYFPNGLPELDITRSETTTRMTICKVVYLRK